MGKCLSQPTCRRKPKHFSRFVNKGWALRHKCSLASTSLECGGLTPLWLRSSVIDNKAASSRRTPKRRLLLSKGGHRGPPLQSVGAEKLVCAELVAVQILFLQEPDCHDAVLLEPAIEFAAIDSKRGGGAHLVSTKLL